jgi:hypothetical protein
MVGRAVRAATAGAILVVCSAPGTPVSSAALSTSPVCALTIAEGIVREFVDAFNRGDPAAADFFEGMAFFAVNDNLTRRSVVVYDVPALRTYLLDRYAHRENIEIRLLESRQGATAGTVGVNYRIFRVADDLDARTPAADGKASVVCTTRKIEAWAMAWPSQ